MSEPLDDRPGGRPTGRGSAASHGQGGARGVYCFPVLPSYTLTHQWLRELGPLARLSAHPDPGVREDLVWTVSGWSTPGVGDLLDRLADDPHPDVREAVEAVREE